MRLALALPLIAALAPSACTSGEVIGGEALPVIATLGECSDAGAACSTWQYLYDCYFGPTGIAGCSAQSTCHASAAGTGAGVSLFVCGPTADTCWQGMTSGPLPLVPKGVTNPMQTTLYTAIHKSTGTAGITANNMPLASIDTQQPAYTFTPADLVCIEGWIKAGGTE